MKIRETVIIGHRARSNGNKAVAIGEQAFANKEAVSLGSEAIAYGSHTVALGMQSYAEQTDDVALGHRAYAKGSQSTALGAHSSVESPKAVAIGYGAKVDHQHTDAIALGAESEADSPSSGSFMIKKDDKSDAKEKTWISEEFAKNFTANKLGGVLSIGKMGTKYRQIVNVAPGTEDTHAVNLGQLREAMKNAGGGGVSYFSVNKLKAETNKNNDGAKAEHSLAIGVAETEMSKGMYSIVIGTANDDGTNTGSGNSQFTKSSGKAAVAIGSIATVEADYGIALGKMAKIHTSATAAIALGKGAEAKVAGAVAIGESAVVETAAGDSIALGKNSKAMDKKNAPDGIDQNINGSNSLKITWSDAGVSSSSGAKDKAVISVGDKNSERVITNVAAGTVVAGSTDAINGGQLYSVINTFGYLGFDVLGAEKANAGTDGFKKTTFEKLKYNGTEHKAKSTFREAIEETITAINAGMKFQGDEGGELTRQLGQTLKIVGEPNGASTTSGTGITTAPGNITVKKANGNGNDTLQIGLSEALKGIKSIENNGTKIELKNNGDKKIELTPENGATLTLTKDNTNGGNHVKATGLSTVGLDDSNALIFKNENNNSNTAVLKVGNADLTFTLIGSNGSQKVKISGVADGSDQNDAVNFKQLEAAKLHFISVNKNGSSHSEKNYNNDEAKATHSIAIGSKASVTNRSDDGIAIGYNSLVENARWSMAIGAETQAKSNQSLALGYQTKVLDGGDGSIAIGTQGTQITNAKWAVALGDKITIEGSGNNVLALGSNLNIGTENENLIIIGNGENGSNSTQIQNAKNSVIIGKHATSQSESAVVIGKDATVQTSAAGAVAIGEGATVSTNAGDSIALGKNSRADDKKNSEASHEFTLGSKSLKFEWGGTGGMKSVVSVGSSNNERVITNVAAGEVRNGSTDAINGGQLYGVIDVFGKLGTDILGAEVDNSTKTFMKTNFAKLKNENGLADGTVKAATTFKEAIEKNIETINKGLIFKVDNGTSTSAVTSTGNSQNQTTRQLGSTITFKGDKHITPSITSDGTISFKINTATQIDDSTGSQTQNDELVTVKVIKDYLTKQLAESTLMLEADNSKSSTFGSVKLKDQKLKLEGDSGYTETEVQNSQQNVKIKLAQSVKDKLAIITVNGKNGDNSFALGKDSKLEAKKEAPKGIVQNVGKDDLTINWEHAGASKNDSDTKEVISVGDQNAERIITHVAAGKVIDDSTDAVNAGQLYSVINTFGHLGFSVLGAEKEEAGKAGFKIPTFTQLMKVDGGKESAAMTFKQAIDNNINKINKGLIFKGDMPSAGTNGTQNTPHYLGSTLSIVRLGMNQAGSSATPAPAGTSSQPNIAEFKGDNLITQYTRETNGNAKIEIGFKDAPMFEKVTLSQKQMYENGTGSGSGASGSTVGENDLITKGYLEQALNKFKFKVENGSGKPIEIGRGDTLKFTSGQNIKVDLAKNGTTPSSTGSTSPSASSASTSAPAPTPAAPAPSPAPAAAPSPTPASSTTTATTTPTTSTTTTGTPTAPTTAVVTIATTDTLENIKSISSPKGSAVGNSGTGSNTEVTKLTLDADKGATFKVGSQGAKVNINKEGITLNKANGAGGASGPAIAIKVGSTASGSSTSNNGPAIEFAKNGTDNKQGTGKITGLADIKEGEKDGTIAVNKNYVDKLAVKYDNEDKKSITLGGKPQDGKAHNPVAIKNLKSALGIDNDSMKGKPESEKQGKSLDLVKKTGF